MSFGLPSIKPLLHYSENEERARFIDFDTVDASMPRKKPSGKRRSGKKRKSRKLAKAAKGVRLVKGRLALRLKGFKGVQRLAPAQLVKYISLGKLRVAAKKVLQHSGGKVVKRRRRKGKKK